MARNTPFTALGRQPKSGLELINSDEPDLLPYGATMDVDALVAQNVERIRQQNSLLQAHAERHNASSAQ